ncbi:CU044_5270 family protein [Streptosporangium sp. NPDC023615]|uniref:CU044_5270 family protein n=1 Tax=Streptosporangium sp. NPDC023615 TaxID=3154794 RepID=UPI00343F7F8F
MVNEIELLREMRDEVPGRLDMSGAERRLAEMTARGLPASGGRERPAYRTWLGLTLAGACVLAVAAMAVTRTQDAGAGLEAAGSAHETTRPTGAAARPSGTVTRPDGVAMVLEQAALVAARSTTTEIRPDQWFYLKESQHLGGNLPPVEIWQGMDGRKSAIRQQGGELKVTAAEKGPTHSGRTQEEVEALPSDPDALLRHFRALERGLYPLSICRPGCSSEIADDVKVFGAIGWYMKFGPMIPPDTAAGMYRALAKIPNVSIERDVTDMDGRRGVGVVFDAGEGVKAYYVLDPDDYRYMGVKVMQGEGEATGMSVLASGIVDRPGDVP